MGLDMATRLVTKRGFIRADELLPGDEALSTTPAGESLWVNPGQASITPFKGETMRVLGGATDALATPGHRVVRRAGFNSTGLGAWKEGSAEGFKPRSTTKIVTAGKGSDTDAPVSDKDIRLAAWLYTDSHLAGGRYWIFYQAKSKVDRILDLVPESQVHVKERRRDIKQVAGKALKKPPQASCEVSVRAGWFNDHLSEIVPDRLTLSSWVWSLSERQVDLLIAEWEWTDGTIPSGRRRTGRGLSTVLYCSKAKLRNELMALMVANGYRVSETEYSPGYWRINATKRMLTDQKTLSVAPELYEGEVWELSIPTGRVFVERGGRVHLTGASSMAATKHKLEPTKEAA